MMTPLPMAREVRATNSTAHRCRSTVTRRQTGGHTFRLQDIFEVLRAPFLQNR